MIKLLLGMTYMDDRIEVGLEELEAVVDGRRRDGGSTRASGMGTLGISRRR